MRFDKHRQPPPYLSRRDQYRMLGLVATLCLVLVGIQWAANPGNWVWFTQLGDGEDAAAVEGGESPPTLEEIDFNALRADNGPLPEDVFRPI